MAIKTADAFLTTSNQQRSNHPFASPHRLKRKKAKKHIVQENTDFPAEHKFFADINSDLLSAAFFPQRL
jgi:hypothetical protein